MQGFAFFASVQPGDVAKVSACLALRYPNRKDFLGAVFFHNGAVEALPGKFAFGYGAASRPAGWDPFVTENELPYAFASIGISDDATEIRVVRDALGIQSAYYAFVD